MNENLEIPLEFYSDVDETPFLKCKVCECDLYNGDVPYTIEKAFKRIDDERDVTLFEIAICIPCAEKQSQKMSKESKAYIESLIGNSDFMEKRQQLWESNWRKSWNSKCLFSGKEVNLNDEYHVVGYFKNKSIIPSMAPFVLGQDFIEEMQENLSAETKEEMDRFGQEYFGPDPSLKELFPDFQIIFV